MFLLRAAFWLSVVVLIIPADPESGTEAPRVGAFQALGAARAAISDMSQFCDRNPDVCVTGSSAFQLMEMKARYGIRMLYQYMDGSEGEDGKAVPDAKTAGGTLSPKDVETPWRGKANS